MLFVSFQSAKDPSKAQKYPEKSACLILTPAPLSRYRQWKDDWLMHRGETYTEVKEEIGQQIWK